MLNFFCIFKIPKMLDFNAYVSQFSFMLEKHMLMGIYTKGFMFLNIVNGFFPCA